ncbi:Crp/Fnr family transcriptional regulator [Bacillus sp. LL01]|uniref:DoxX family protein n=1 Tax=Bacillus sp. LL01 TaxID=1665556 RepID=UPI00064D6C77|nr:DoxX family protein [Bacillus sp. LL01]KMJ57386.1 Crp/Fnr family transcriptional regulator [Bacillus sp. LL01]
MKWLRGPKMAILWTVLRIWLGVQWLKAGLPKIGAFDAEGFLHGAIAKAEGANPAVQGWYAGFLENVALPNVGLINILIPWGEVLVGIALILGLATLPALVGAAFMNLNFLLAGTVSTNPVLYTVAILLIAAGAAATFYGLDRFAIRWIKDRWNGRKMRGAGGNDGETVDRGHAAAH